MVEREPEEIEQLQQHLVAEIDEEQPVKLPVLVGEWLPSLGEEPAARVEHRAYFESVVRRSRRPGADSAPR